MPEVQSHGFVFEKWIRETFFDGYSTSYGSKWDVSKEINTEFGNLPISIKTAKYRSSINLGDAIRQFSIDEDFILVVGFWVQENSFKKCVKVVPAKITIQQWKEIWDPITLKELSSLDSLIKDYETDHRIIRKKAQILKLSEPFSNCKITLNPKIDSGSQRRLQCSLGYKLFCEMVTDKELEIETETALPKLWGKEVLSQWNSSPRKFNKKI